jgi:hypothetical protein
MEENPAICRRVSSDRVPVLNFPVAKRPLSSPQPDPHD